jgi:hypothetical protein
VAQVYGLLRLRRGIPYDPGMEIVTRKQALEQGLKSYFTGKPCKRGHLAARRTSDSWCRECATAKTKAYAQANAEAISEKKKARRLADIERIREHKKSYWAANKERFQEKHRAYQSANRERVRAANNAYQKSNRVSINDRNRTRYQLEPQFRSSLLLRNRMNQALAQAGAIKSASLLKLLGTDKAGLIAHLEAQFTEGMTWDNWARDGWHVDHIKPCASFDLTDPEQQKLCFHYTNLQPLWGEENLRKSDRLDWAT